ncbi:MAG: gliding motility-associated C-terminal domain-containing protein [Bacteroidales bacterium]|nr:gliding motility-associated C-terminal domain-containing protein [Bacteroidales bacterium]
MNKPNLRRIIKILFFSILLILESQLWLSAQKDTEFWFVAPAVSKNHCSGAPGCNTGAAPVSFIITTYDQPATVTISQPANELSALNPTGFAPIVINIPANSTHREELWSDNFESIPAESQMRKNVENWPDKTDPKLVQNKGIHITATNFISVYYEVEEAFNSDIFSLKGKNALGTEFYTPFQTNNINHYFNPSLYEPLYSAIDIVAVDPGNTVVVIYPTNEVLGWGTPDSIVITLQQGETYSVIPGHINAGSYVYHNQPNLRLAGTRIKTRDGQRIAVTLKDDSVEGDSGCWDLMGDQNVPVNAVSDSGSLSPIIGAEYVIMKGDLSVNDWDRAYILATQDNTKVKVTDVTNSLSYNYTLNAGEQVKHTIANNAQISYIKSDDDNKPIYVMHVTGAQDGCEIGEAVLPSISRCTGSFRVGFYRSDPQGSKDFLMNIMGRTGALDAFVLNGDSTSINAGAFVQIPGTDWWVASFNKSAEILASTVNLIENYKDIFHLGIMHGGSSNGGNYGYFSNYNVIEARSFIGGTGQPNYKGCYGETIQLIASGGIVYEWIPPTYLNDPTSDQPFCTPYSSQKYKVVVKGASCQVPDTADVTVQISDSINIRFTTDITEGCAPLAVTVNDESYGAIEKTYRWEWGDGTETNDTMNPAPHIYRNTTDSIIDYTIHLVALNNYCIGSWDQTIRVYPEINAGFSQDTTAGCQPLGIQFTNTSTGNLDTTGFFWNFGDFGQSFKSNPFHTFTNIGNVDSTYSVRLVTRSPFYCTDTATASITVHPIITASLSIDSSLSCSPLNTNLNAGNSKGVDTFFWTINYPLIEDVITTTNSNPITINYSDTSQLNGPDTIKVNLTTMNSMGCSASVPQQKIIIYPEVDASFDISINAICDSLPINFTNNSKGYNLLYNWDFGDGRTAQDTLKSNYTRIFRNQTTATKPYIVTLLATSDYFCSSTFDTTILVHPFVNASFTVDYANNCTPLDAIIYNKSVRVNDYTWDFGDGSAISTISDSVINHQYWNPTENKDTSYMIKLLVENLEGCLDSLEKEVLVYPQVVASFNMLDSVGCNPLTVSFTNNSKGNNLFFDWTFGNFSNSIPDFNFSRTFSHNGSSDSTFLATLRAYNLYGCDSSVSKPITLYAFVDAKFTLANADSCSPFNIQITNLSSAGTTSWDWDFGDGGNSTLFEPLHQYINQSGTTRTDTLKLIVKNNHDCFDNYQQIIKVYPEVTSSFMVDTTEGCQPLAITFTNNTNITAGTQFTWDFDDGTISTNLTPPVKTYGNSQPNSIFRNINLNAMTQYGCSDDTTITIEVYPFISAKFSIDKPFICSGENFIINRSASSGGINSYAWDYKTGTSARSDAVYNYSYDNFGISTDTRIIDLLVKNVQNCESSWSEQILVHPQVRANFDIDVYESCYPHTFEFTNTSNLDVATSYLWDFGDGTYSIDIHPDNSYINFSKTLDSTYIVSLLATSDYGCDSSISKSLTVHPKPKADFNFPIAVDCPPFEIPFQNLSKGTNLSYSWDFDDGNISSDINPVEIFYNNNSEIKENIISLSVATPFGCEDLIQKTIRIYPNVTVDFGATDWIGCSPLTVVFDGMANNYNELQWYVNEQPFSTLDNPSYRFVNETATDKIFNIRFKANSLYNCIADTTKQVTIHATPRAEFIPDPILQDFNTDTDISIVTFTNYTTNQPYFNYFWDFGNGTTSGESDLNFNKEYLEWGDINNKNQIPVTLISWNDNFPECADTAFHNIIINPPLPQIDLAEDIAACVPFTINFSATTKYIYQNSYLWKFGFNNETSTESEPVFTFTEPGDYITKLIVEGDGGTNWDYKKITVYPKPIVDFTFSPDKVLVESQTNPPKPVKFYNHTQLGETFEWWFGDGNFSYDREPTHVYRDTGTFNILLIAATENSCIDSLVHPKSIYVGAEGKLVFPTGFTVDPASAADENYDPEEPNPYIFRPVASGIKKYKLEIYNRWGALVFETEDVNKGWNGYINGEIAKQDVYIWKVKATFTNGEPYVAAGDITLIVLPTSSQ